MSKGIAAFPVFALAALFAATGARPVPTPVRRAPPGLGAGAVVVLGLPELAGWTGQPISLDLKDADIRDVLKAFAKLEKFNLAIDPDVKGSVTVRLENVPWDQALDVILRMNRLGFVLEGTILRIGKPSRLMPGP